MNEWMDEDGMRRSRNKPDEEGQTGSIYLGLRFIMNWPSFDHSTCRHQRRSGGDAC